MPGVVPGQCLLAVGGCGAGRGVSGRVIAVGGRARAARSGGAGRGEGVGLAGVVGVVGAGVGCAVQAVLGLFGPLAERVEVPGGPIRAACDSGADGGPAVVGGVGGASVGGGPGFGEPVESVIAEALGLGAAVLAGLGLGEGVAGGVVGVGALIDPARRICGIGFGKQRVDEGPGVGIEGVGDVCVVGQVVAEFCLSDLAIGGGCERGFC